MAADASRRAAWMQGHTYTNFKNPQVEGMLLRAIAWAAHYPVETLVNGTAPSRGVPQDYVEAHKWFGPAAACA